MITITTGAGYHEVHPHTVTKEDALDTYRKTVRNVHKAEWPNWVLTISEVLLCEKNKDVLLHFEPWVMGVYNELKKQ